MTDLSRRAVFGSALMAMVSGPPGPAARAAPSDAFFTRHGLPIGVQLYTLADDLVRDCEGVLRKVAAIGYRTVEMPAGAYERDPKDAAAVLQRVGLECPSIHVLAADLGAPGEAPDSFKRAVHAAAVLGCKFICVPNFPAPASLSPPKAGADPFAYFLAAAAAMRADDWKRFASLLNERGDFLRRSGLLLAYHNHNVEFAPVESVTGYDLLLAGTNPALVSFELDVGWVAAAGVDPLVLLRQQMGRFRLMHVKDIDRRTVPNFVARQVPATVGAGILPWASLLKAAVAAGVDQFFVEQEPPYTGSPLDAVRASYDYLAQLRA